MPAVIVINQATKPAGVAGKARSDGVISQLVTCTNDTVESSYLWTLIDCPIRSALTRGSTGTGSSFTFTPDVKGTYLVSLRVNGSSAPGDNDTSYIAIRSFGTNTLAWRYLSTGEATEDNETYAGLGFASNINVRGWATNEDLIFEEIETAVAKVEAAISTFSGLVSRLVLTEAGTGKVSTTIIPGTVPTGSAGGDLDGTYPNPDVIALRNRAIEAAFTPVDGDTIMWDTAEFVATPLTLQTAYDNDEEIVLAGSVPVKITDSGDTLTLAPDLISTEVEMTIQPVSVAGPGLALNIVAGDSSGDVAGPLHLRGGDGVDGAGVLISGGVGTPGTDGIIFIGAADTSAILSGPVGVGIPWTHRGEFGVTLGTVTGVDNLRSRVRTLAGTSGSLAEDDNGGIVLCTNAATVTLDISTLSVVGYSAAIVQMGTGTVELDDGGVHTFFVKGSVSSPPQTLEQYSIICITCIDVSEFLIYGDLG